MPDAETSHSLALQIAGFAMLAAVVYANTIVMKRGLWIALMRNSNMPHRQKSKLIIFFITMMPIDIQMTQPTSMS